MDYISSAQIHKRVLMTPLLRHLERDWLADSGLYGSVLAPVTFHEKSSHEVFPKVAFAFPWVIFIGIATLRGPSDLEQSSFYHTYSFNSGCN